MRLVGGADTSAGRVRSENQDRPVLTPWVAGVADGMGGHLGGETAASLAVAELAALQGPLDVDQLVEAVHAANQRILSQADDPSLRGMGTTLVALTLHAGDVVLINVGDSRAYRLADGQLEQLTRDHSLVEDMVRQGQLSPDEARHHPQRNIVTRALGIGARLDVDVFRTPARLGDRYLLCSDGLFNEVEPADIAEVLRVRRDPDEAARDLVDLANEAGARDNVTCVVVDVEDEAGGAATVADDVGAASGAGYDAGAAGGGTVLATRSAGGQSSTAQVLDRTVRSQATSSSRETSELLLDHAIPPVPHATAGRFRGFVRALAYVLPVVLLAAVVAGGMWWWGRSGYYVDQVDGRVAILQGRPGGVLWLDPTVVEQSDIRYDQLTGAAQQRLAEPPVGSLDQARALVVALRQQTVVSGDRRALPPAPPPSSTPPGGGLGPGTTTPQPTTTAQP